MDQGAQGRAQIYSVSKKRQGLSTNTERERQEVAEEIKYIGVETQLIDTKATAKENSATLKKKFDLEDQVDTFIEASGAESSIQLGIYLAKLGGYYIQTGIGKPNPQVPMLAICEKELHVRGCFRYGPGDFDLAVKFLSQESVN